MRPWQVTVISLFVAAGSVPAQWPSPKTVGIPRTPDGKADLSAKAPRTRDGRPNLSGLWTIETEKFWEDIGAGLKPEEVPLQPWAATLFRERRANLGKDNPIARCMPAGVPTIDTIPTPHKIIQTPSFIAILYEYNMQYRQIFSVAATIRFLVKPVVLTGSFLCLRCGHCPITVHTERSQSVTIRRRFFADDDQFLTPATSD